MIPRKIHYCWFGPGKQGLLIRRCIASWQCNLAGYEIILWDENRFDVESHPFTAAAYRCGKYAFVSDYVRMHALHTEGGVYLDTDVEVYRTFDALLSARFFIGLEDEARFATSVIGSVAGHWLSKAMLEFYDNTPFDIDALKSLVNVNHVSSLLLESGFSGMPGMVEVREEDVVYPMGTFGKLRKPNDWKKVPGAIKYACHLYVGSWRNSRKGLPSRAWRYLRKGMTKDLVSAYKLLSYTFGK